LLQEENDLAGAPLLGAPPMKVPPHFREWWARGLQLHQNLSDDKLAF